MNNDVCSYHQQLMEDIGELKIDIALTKKDVKWLVDDRLEQRRKYEEQLKEKRQDRKDDLALDVARDAVQVDRSWSHSERLWTIVGILVSAVIGISALVYASVK